MSDKQLLEFFQMIVDGEIAHIRGQLKTCPSLATLAVRTGATRRDANTWFLTSISRHVYAGDTALHIAAAAFKPAICKLFIKHGADVSAQNRRGCEPLHYAAESAASNPRAQAATIRTLLAAGAVVDSENREGMTPLHKAVRARSSAAVKALINGEADVQKANASGSTPMTLAVHSTGRSGSGSDAAHKAQAEIIRLLKTSGAS